VRFADVVYLAFSALLQQKVRTTLTLLGVMIGTFVLLLSLSIGQGVRETIVREYRRNDQLRRIEVFPDRNVMAEDIPSEELVVKGEMSEARRGRLRQARIARWQGRRATKAEKRLTPERLQELAAIDHVESVTPSIRWDGRLYFRNKIVNVTASSSAPDDRYYRDRIVAGTYFSADQPRSLVVSEIFLYYLGIIDEADVERVLGSEMELEFSSRQGKHWSVASILGAGGRKLEPMQEDVLAKIAEQLPAAIEHLNLTASERLLLQKMTGRTKPSADRFSFEIREKFTLVGVLRDPTDEEARRRWYSRFDDISVHCSKMQEMFFRVPDNREYGVGRAEIVVDSEDNVEAVEQLISDLGFHTFSLAAILKHLRLNVLLISFATTFVAIVALVVAGLGITNTLLMSVLERTHEIGVMKAVGARDRHIQLLFLLEGAWVGLLGSAVGLLCGWLASIPGDRIAQRLAEQQAKILLGHSLFVFPVWLLVGVPMFVTLLTMLAALYPARRAARVNPMTALRYE
jgi:putative ABC transport system permease protein